MTSLKKRLLGTIVGGIVGGIVGVATVSGVGVALASNGDRSGGTPSITTPVSASTSDVRGTGERGEHEPGEDRGHDESVSGGDQGEHGDNSGPADEQGEHGGNSGPGGDEGEHGDSSTND